MLYEERCIASDRLTSCQRWQTKLAHESIQDGIELERVKGRNLSGQDADMRGVATRSQGGGSPRHPALVRREVEGPISL